MAASVDLAAAAVIYAGATALSWGEALAVPGVQALANISVLNRQNRMYTSIRREQRRLIGDSLDHYVNQLQSILPDLKDAYPDKPKAARYVPVNPCTVQREQIECNLSSMDSADEWAQCINRRNNQSDIARAVFFDPRWVQHVELYSMSVGDLLRGRFPVNSALPVVGDSDEASAFAARTGGIGFRPAASYGLSQGRMILTGMDALAAESEMLEIVSPHNRQVDIRDMMQTPQQRIALALTQAQLIQNSLQNVLNREAQKPPYKLAQINVRLERAINKLQQEASKASLINTFVPNYVAILQPQINELTRGIGAAMTTTPTPATLGTPYEAFADYEPRVLPTK